MARTSTARRPQSPKSIAVVRHRAAANRAAFMAKIVVFDEHGNLVEDSSHPKAGVKYDKWRKQGRAEKRARRQDQMAVFTLAEGVADTVDWRPPRAYRNSLTSRERFRIAKWEREARRREAEWCRQDAEMLAAMDKAMAFVEDKEPIAPVAPERNFGLAMRQRAEHERHAWTPRPDRPRVVLPPHLRVPEDEERRVTGYRGGRTRHQQARLTSGAF
ncbi:hypothetical protein IPM09_02545 [Candidatus Saccharibacteria bacterium]|nr:MAG: hypothetical protein IPM09_02545 [Candidatus Saccharibacteria bacterium]